MKILRELVELDENINALPLLEALDESVIELQEKGIIPKAIKGAKDLVGKNPALAIGAAALAVNAYSSYKKNKRNMIQLHGKSYAEKNMMDDIVKKLTSSGSWKLQKVKFESGGKTWYLKKL